MLDPIEQQVFRALGVFVGTFDVDAASAVAGVSRGEAADVVESLIVKSLVQPSEQPGRFRLLETLKAYAEDRLVDTGEAATIRAAHFDHYLHTVVQSNRLAAYTIGFWDLGNPGRRCRAVGVSNPRYYPTRSETELPAGLIGEI